LSPGLLSKRLVAWPVFNSGGINRVAFCGEKSFWLPGLTRQRLLHIFQIKLSSDADDEQHLNNYGQAEGDQDSD
jgi:hypothetical protein